MPPLAAWNLLSCAIFLFCYWLNRRGYPHTTLLIGAAEVVTHAALAVAYVGWNSGFHYYILGLVPLIFYSQRWRFPLKMALTALLCGLYVALFAWMAGAAPWVSVDARQLQLTGILNTVILFVVFAAVAAYYRLAAANAETALQKANRLLDQQAHTDPLTHVANRRDMEARLALAVADYRANGTPFSVVLCDIDNFKAFNDRYGHAAGDLILVDVAGRLRAGLREQDHVARWGGEEFLLFLPGACQEKAWSAAERIREQVAAARLAVGDQTVAITLTLGVAEYAAEADPAGCIQRADAALYAGKHRGKNRVEAAGPAVPLAAVGPQPDSP